MSKMKQFCRSPIFFMTSLGVSVMLITSLASARSIQVGTPNAIATESHDKAFWQEIKNNEFRIPPGAAADQLASELSSLLASPDPELRDDMAQTILTAWMYQTRALTAPAIRRLSAQWLLNLKSPVGGDSAILRSFSSLMLSVAVARDNIDHFLTEQEFREIKQGALQYLQHENDSRGFDDKLGWIHSGAHSADLLKFLGRSRYLTPSGQSEFLSSIQNKIESSETVYRYGEDERLARAIVSIINRNDFNLAGFTAWLTKVRPKFPNPPSEISLQRYQNTKNILSKLEVILSTQPEPTPQQASALKPLRAALANSF